MLELFYVSCTYGRCTWTIPVMSARAAEQVFNSHAEDCPHRKHLITGSTGFFRCPHEGCDWVRWYGRGKQKLAEHHRVLHQRICRHQDPLPSEDPRLPGSPG